MWAAEHRYPYMCLNTTAEATEKIWETYTETAARVGYGPGPENLGYLQRVHVQDTEENAQQFMWMMGEFTGLGHPVWSNPAGYGSPARRRELVEFANGRRSNPRLDRGNSFEKQLEIKQIVAGTPDQVVAQLRSKILRTRPGIMALWGNDGGVSHKDSMRCIELLGKEVMPALRDLGQELGLKSPFEVESPVSLAATPEEERAPVAG